MKPQSREESEHGARQKAHEIDALKTIRHQPDTRFTRRYKFPYLRKSRSFTARSLSDLG